MQNCQHCGKPTNNQKFCSRSCSNIVSNITSPKRKPIERVCKWCKTKFTPPVRSKERSLLCPKCREEHNKEDYYKNRTLGYYHSQESVLHKHPSWKNSHVRILNRHWNANMLEQPCQRCGYSKHVELCHIKPISQFPETATLGEVNSPTNNIPLCPNCHWELDNGLYKLASPVGL